MMYKYSGIHWYQLVPISIMTRVDSTRVKLKKNLIFIEITLEIGENGATGAKKDYI